MVEQHKASSKRVRMRSAGDHLDHPAPKRSRSRIPVIDLSPSSFSTKARTVEVINKATRKRRQSYGNDALVSLVCSAESMHQDDMQRMQKKLLLLLSGSAYRPELLINAETGACWSSQVLCERLHLLLDEGERLTARDTTIGPFRLLSARSKLDWINIKRRLRLYGLRLSVKASNLAALIILLTVAYYRRAVGVGVHAVLWSIPSTVAQVVAAVAGYLGSAIATSKASIGVKTVVGSLVLKGGYELARTACRKCKSLAVYRHLSVMASVVYAIFTQHELQDKIEAWSASKNAGVSPEMQQHMDMNMMFVNRVVDIQSNEMSLGELSNELERLMNGPSQPDAVRRMASACASVCTSRRKRQADTGIGEPDTYDNAYDARSRHTLRRMLMRIQRDAAAPYVTAYHFFHLDGRERSSVEIVKAFVLLQRARTQSEVAFSAVTLSEAIRDCIAHTSPLVR